MAHKKKTLVERLSTLEFSFISLLFFALGLVLYIFAYMSQPVREGWQKVVMDFGSFLMAGVAIGFLWDFFGKRAFQRETLETTQMAAQLNIAGIRDYLPNYHQWHGWEEAIQTADTLDIFAAYPANWSGTYGPNLRQLVANGKKIRVILADPNAEEMVAVLAQRFGNKPEDVCYEIRKLQKEFEELSTSRNQVEVRKSSGGHPVKLILFDRVCLLVTYSLRKKQEAPALVAKKGGQLYDYVREEFEAAWNAAQPF